jgi:hypothetical protein
VEPEQSEIEFDLNESSIGNGVTRTIPGWSETVRTLGPGNKNGSQVELSPEVSVRLRPGRLC